MCLGCPVCIHIGDAIYICTMVKLYIKGNQLASTIPMYPKQSFQVPYTLEYITVWMYSVWAYYINMWLIIVQVTCSMVF